MQAGKFDISPNFPLPIFAICLWKLSLAGWASMPKATVYEDNDSPIRKDHIRFAFDVGNVFLPSFQSHSCKHGPEAPFECCPTTLDGLHCLPSIFRLEVVAHVPVEKPAQSVADDETLWCHSQPVDLRCAEQSMRLLVRIPRRQIQ